MKILNLTEKSYEDWVEVDSQETLWGNGGLLTDKEVLIEFVLSAFLNTLLPLLDLKIFELAEILAKRGIELLNIFVLFSVLNGLRKSRKSLHWLLDSLIETIGPVKSTSNRWKVIWDGCSLVNAVDKSTTLHEDLLNSLKILLVKFK